MYLLRLASAPVIAAASFSPLAIHEARAQSAGSNDAEIALLKKQLRLMEQRLDALQRQSAANAKAVATANAKADAGAALANANAALPGKGPVRSADAAVLTMPGNRPTFCTAD